MAMGFVSINIILMLTNLFFRFSGRITPSSFDFGSFGVVILFLVGSLYLLYFPGRVRWFGSKLDGGHDANSIVGYIFATMFGVGALMFNLAPLLGTH